VVTTRRFARIVLAYSGSLNSAVAIPWLVERYAAEIVTVTIDLECRPQFVPSPLDPRLTTEIVTARS
jgi:hypothetical protein